MGKPIKKIIIPVNITHNGDMDGEGCAFLTKYIFNDSRMRSTDKNHPLPTTYTRTPEEINDCLGYFRSDRKRNRKLEQKMKELRATYCNDPATYERKLEQYINRASIPKKSDKYDDGLVDEHDQIAFSKPIIIGIPNTFDEEILCKDIITQVIDKIANMKKDIADCNSKRDTIEILYIITDIYVPVDVLRKSYEEISSNRCYVVGMKYWSFDHHVSNPDYHKSYISKTADIIVRNRPWGDVADSAYIADDVVICEGYHIEHIYESIHPFAETYGFEAMIPVIDYCLQLDMFEDHLFWKRSATFHYFLFLLKAGFFSLDGKNDDLVYIRAVTWIVYIITMYDTFEFDIKELPVKISLPDALTIMFKRVGKFGVMTDLLTSFIECEAYQRSFIRHYDENGNMIENTYSDIPLPSDTIVRLAELVENRENKFMRELYSAKTITINQLRDIFDPNEEAYKDTMAILDSYTDDLKILLFAGNVDDASYTGNTCCKRYGFDLAIMMYNEKRIISLRSNNKQDTPFDCVTLAKSLGGGGHVCAAGCSLEADIYTNLLHLFWTHGRPVKEYLEGMEYAV